MIKSVSSYPLSTILDIESQVIYTILRYPREYKWGKNSWSADAIEGRTATLVQNAMKLFELPPGAV